MDRTDDFPRSGWRRTLLLGGALAAAGIAFVALSLSGPRGPEVPAPTRLAFVGLVPAAHAASIDVRIAADQSGDGAAKPAETAPQDGAAAPAPAGKPKAGVNVTIDGDQERIVVKGFGQDEEYESFAQFVEQAPWLAALVFVCVFLVFLVPLLFVVLLIWYKVRKTRMLNETMLKLAEKGVIAPGDAISALAEGRQAAAIASVEASTAPLYEQARQIRRRAAWSDLRKGVILTAIGFALSAWQMIEDREANVVGLVLLFLGFGYLMLWYFEDRQTEPRERGAPPAGGA